MKNLKFSTKQPKSKEEMDRERELLKPWVEKYRPKKVSDVVYQTEVVSALQRSIETGNMPHLLFYGPPGTGKTSTILAIARQLYGPDLFKRYVLELNASDERGIGVVREKVKDFAQFTVGKDPTGRYPCPPYKIIILDEADLMTEDAQNALRRTMEKFTGVTRFCLICNYVSRIIEPITSRCAKFRFKPLNSECITSKLSEIAQLENFELSPDVTEKLVEVSEGDMRKAITLLQSTHRLYGSNLNYDSIVQISGEVPDDKIQAIFSASQNHNVPQVVSRIESLLADGYCALNILDQCYNKVVQNGFMTDEQKSKAIEKIAEADLALTEGADEFLQLLTVFTSHEMAL
eukprot:TRINITY_DN4058_c0_g1_i1.p1 TRINITY_DN4058_c0_g1~~TRINITY_DN4058_c0_g1_i1.p1  ORF type:complete len:347 (+),score=81.08 TRINITY_DN4058_c0_g1_i1:30-1070(+)